MSLALLQAAMGEVLLHGTGKNALGDDPGWRAFLRTPGGKPLEGCSRERLFLYEELLFASVEDTLRSLFPCTHKCLEKDWHALVERYRRKYPNTSFQLYKVAEGFAEFVDSLKDFKKEFPFLSDLARYEWLEIEVLNEPNSTVPDDFAEGFPDNAEALAAFRPVPNTAQRLGTFEYPVPAIIEEINRQLEADEPLKVNAFPKAPCAILIYRDPETHRARFFNLNPLTQMVVAGFPQAQSYLQLFETIVAQTPAVQNIPFEAVLTQGIGLLNQCFQEKILLGSAPACSK